jgi:ABC-type sugar transport system ATPase subunit
VALAVTGMAKAFGATPALADADLRVSKGTIHALLGGNGSGKSTLIKCIAGVYQADTGTVEIYGDKHNARDITPVLARRMQLRFVHQDLALFPDLSIAENLALYGGYPTTRPFRSVRWRQLERDVANLLERYEIAARPTDLVASLRPSQRSMVAVARALAGDEGEKSILLLDEPTATLAEHEAHELLQSLRTRANAGQTIVLVSHRFPEVQGIADDVTVFRDGRVAATDRMSSMPISRLVTSMTGDSRPSQATGAARQTTDAPQTLVVSGLSVGAAHAATFEVRSGEIVGLAGLGGSGRSSLLRGIFGSLRPTAGTMTFDGAPYLPKSESDAMRTGVALVPEDRYADAAFLDLSVRENISVSVLRSYWRYLHMGRSVETEATRELITKYGIKADGPEAPLGSLSGGNQQKAILARWLQRKPTLLLLDEPTQGVDIVARAEIYATISDAAANGTAVLVASSDLDELLALTDRVLVLRAGQIVAELATSSTSREELAHLSMLDLENMPDQETVTRNTL